MSAERYHKDGFGWRTRFIQRATAIASGFTEFAHDFFENAGPAPEAPSFSSSPSIAVTSGDGSAGSVLTVTPGEVDGQPAPNDSYQWQADASDIANATGLTYDSTALSGGEAITCIQTATNSEGSASSTSNEVTLS